MGVFSASPAIFHHPPSFTPTPAPHPEGLMAGFERPFVLHFSTMTVDGRIASSTRYSMLSCRFDLERLYALRSRVDAVMVGAGTVLADNPRLARRLKPGRHYRVVVDCRLRVPPDARVFDDSMPSILVTCRDAPRERLSEIAGRGVEIIEAGEAGRIELREALRTLLESYGVRRVLVEGGGVLAYSLYRERLVDELRVTVAPVLFAAGRSIVDDPEGRGFPDWGSSPRLQLVYTETCPCGNCVHMVYRVDSDCCPAASPPPRPLRELLE